MLDYCNSLLFSAPASTVDKLHIAPKTFWLAWFSRQVSCQRQAFAMPIALAASERAHLTQGGAPHIQGAQHVARLPRVAAAASCANQVAAVFRRTSTAFREPRPTSASGLSASLHH